MEPQDEWLLEPFGKSESFLEVRSLYNSITENRARGIGMDYRIPPGTTLEIVQREIMYGEWTEPNVKLMKSRFVRMSSD